VTATIRTRDLRLASDPTVRVVLQNLGLACCTLEVEAAVHSGLLVAGGDGGEPASGTILLVSGTVTAALAPAVAAALARLPGPVSVLAVGACATSGGPYWDAPTVVAGVDRLVPVDAYVPGCPPRPEALVAAIAQLAGDPCGT
jgi:NADH-quinone oxidoreductase subunit B